MKRTITLVGAVTAALMFGHSASANLGLDGNVYCDANDDGSITIGTDLPLNGVGVNVSGDLGFAESVSTGEFFGIDGYYTLPLSPDVPQTYNVSLDAASIPGGAGVIQPATGDYIFTGTAVGQLFRRNFLVDASACTDEPELGCWMTAGGVKFSNFTGGTVAQHGPKVNLGGNVFPSCDPDPGNGGQWNHVDHQNQLHFQGFDIFTVECGNVPGIEEGSESPVTPFNYIEFAGTGRIQGIKGNKLSETDVSFFARVEDRNEPGNERASDGEDIDKYFIHVFSDAGDPFGTTILLTDGDGDPTTVDPITITGGNLQLHSSSCD